MCVNGLFLQRYDFFGKHNRIDEKNVFLQPYEFTFKPRQRPLPLPQRPPCRLVGRPHDCHYTNVGMGADLPIINLLDNTANEAGGLF